MSCKCPEGFPETKWEPFDVLRPAYTHWRIDILFRRHTGRCPLTDELLTTRKAA